MGDPLKKVVRGQPINIAAESFNSFIDAARYAKGRQVPQVSGGPGQARPANTIFVRNDSGASCDRFAVLGIDDIIFGPSDNLDEFQNNAAFSCVTPAAGTHEGKFVILAEPADTDEIARAFAFGVCPVLVNVQSENDGWAEIADGVATNLKSGPCGSAQIMYMGPQQEGSNNRWCVVRFPIPAASLFGKITGGGLPTTGQPLKIAVNPCANDGSHVNGDVTVNVYHRWKYGIGSSDALPLPQLNEGDVIAYLPIGAGSDGNPEGILLGDWTMPAAPNDDYYYLTVDHTTGKLKWDRVRAVTPT